MTRTPTNDPPELAEAIKGEALRLGFDKVGISQAGALGEEADRLREWLKRGYHGSMEWMARREEQRTDPELVLPGARSVISVAMNYFTSPRHPDDAESGKISRYAWGDDYHEVLSGRLRSLLTFVTELCPGAHGKAYVDTGPVMEKAWAQRAGIGWVGKHTNLITTDHGSWVFLGELIVDVKLAWDAPAVDHCGTCTLCIEACPTVAIVEPYVLDAARCISYLTIEHRGEIARELGEKFDRWIYGCDICQDVCPWNETFARPTARTEFAPRADQLAPRLEEMAALDQGEFSRRFRKSPVKRTKLAGLVRNADLIIRTRKAKEENHGTPS